MTAYIDEHRGRFGVEPICRALGVSASAYLSERESTEPRSVVGLPVPPRYTAVGPREETTLASRLSSPITFLATSPEGGSRPSRVRIAEDIDTIECVVAYNAHPPPTHLNLTAREAPNPWEGWATTVRASSNPSRASGTTSAS